MEITYHYNCPTESPCCRWRAIWDESADPSGKFLLVDLSADVVCSAGDNVIEAQVDSVGGCLLSG
jgi:hypothetical protein